MGTVDETARPPDPTNRQLEGGIERNPATAGASHPPSPAPPASDLSPRRQHPALIFLGTIRQLRGLALPLVILLVSGGGRSEGPFLALGGLLAIGGLVSQAVAWWEFRYEVTGGELRVVSGILSKRERLVPLERIQAVDLDETPLQRLFGVVGLRIETAAGGSAGSDVSLLALSKGEAERLRARISLTRPTSRSTDGSSGTPATLADRTPGVTSAADAGVHLIRRIGTGELLVAGATSGRVGPALAVLSFAFQLVDDVLPETFWERIALGAPGWTLRGLITTVLVVAIGAWLLAIGSTALTFGGFELRRDGDNLLVAYGLLDRRRRTIPVARIQAVAVSEGLLRRPFGLAAVRFESAGYGKDTAESGVLFPLLRRSEVPALLEAACPTFATSLDPSVLTPLPARAAGRYALAGVWPLLGLAGVGVILAAGLPMLRWWWGLLPLAVTPLAAASGLIGFRATGWTVDAQERLVVRGGGIERVTAIVPRRRIQRRAVNQDFLQRRAALASFAAAVASGGAGGRLRVEHLDAADADRLLFSLAVSRTTATSTKRVVAD